jgi:hypothetical protein
MRDGHFGKRVRHNQCDNRSEKISDDDARTGKFNCYAATEEKAHSDRATDRDHAELTLGQTTLERRAPMSFVQDRRFFCARHVSACTLWRPL